MGRSRSNMTCNPCINTGSLFGLQLQHEWDILKSISAWGKELHHHPSVVVHLLDCGLMLTSKIDFNWRKARFCISKINHCNLKNYEITRVVLKLIGERDTLHTRNMTREHLNSTPAQYTCIARNIEIPMEFKGELIYKSMFSLHRLRNKRPQIRILNAQALRENCLNG